MRYLICKDRLILSMSLMRYLICKDRLILSLSYFLIAQIA